MGPKLKAYLRLTRPPNLVTAVSDIWAGAALSGYFLLPEKVFSFLILLSLSSVFLYAGGVVFNDVCDAALDAKERPERPIPSGIVSINAAILFGSILFITGIVLAGFVNGRSALLALLITVACLLYDRWGKPHVFWGPLTMGSCRGLNLLLGMSILSFQVESPYWIALVPIVYIAAITLISRGEVHGGNRSAVLTALVFYLLVLGALIGIAISTGEVWVFALFVLLFILFIFPPLLKAIQTLSGKHIGKAVKAGVLGLILMNACWVAIGAPWEWAVATALLLPLSIWIAKGFAVT